MVPALVALLLLLGYGWFLYDVQRHGTHGSSRVLYVGSTLQILPEILSLLSQRPDAPFIEPGAGLGHVGFAIAKAQPNRKVVLIERSWQLVVLLYVRRFFLGTYNVQIIHGDIFTCSWPWQNAVVYCYLTSELVKQLASRPELQGSLFAVLCFEFPERKPEKTFTFSGWQSPLRVYEG